MTGILEKDFTCCFSGHRSKKLPWGSNDNDSRCLSLRREIQSRLEGIYDSGYRHFICGMALGCDKYFAQEVILLREKYPDVTLEAAVPCVNQSEKWNKKQQAEYHDILNCCDKVTVLQEQYSRGCMMERNKYMVDRSSLLLACYDGIPGGTMNTIVYARRQNVPVIIIDIDKEPLTEAANE